MNLHSNENASQTEQESRRIEFRRNENLEVLIQRFSQWLEPAERLVTRDVITTGNVHPLVFVLGPPRSGTTLMMQWLAASGQVSYPTNFLSRFYGAPILGAQLQKLLTDPKYQFRDELSDLAKPVDYVSQNGKTSGALAPNEFWYFWRRFLPFGELDWAPDEALWASECRDRLSKELRLLTRVFDKPFAMKGMILNAHARFLHSLAPRVLLIRMRRDPAANVLALMDARRRQFGSEDRWYSFKIKEHRDLMAHAPLTQVCGQIHCIHQALDRELGQLPASDVLEIPYEDFCHRPEYYHNKLAGSLGLKHKAYHGPKSFSVTRPVAEEDQQVIDGILARFATGDLSKTGSDLPAPSV